MKENIIYPVYIDCSIVNTLKTNKNIKLGIVLLTSGPHSVDKLQA